MKRLVTRVVFLALAQAIVLAQGRGVRIEGKEVPRTTTSYSVRLTNTPGLAPPT